MDPLTHTLVGASLAQTRLTRATPLAAATLIIGANLPDIDAAMMFVGSDAALGARRGWTHGVLALAVLPWLLAAALVLFDRLVRRRRDATLKPVQFGPVLGLAYLSVLTHPCLDWLNTYGIRLLMPFDGRWFYGDAIFIVDPWIWLLAGSAVVLAHTRSLSSHRGVGRARDVADAAGHRRESGAGPRQGGLVRRRLVDRRCASVG